MQRACVVCIDTTSYCTFSMYGNCSCVSLVALQNHGDADCFVCVLMSHGDRDGIYGTDNKPLRIKDITSLFKGDKCESLVGKPKLFFIQVS